MTHGIVADLKGARFGRLLVIERSFEDTRHRAAKWLCICDCGKDTVQRADVLKIGHAQSCGCFGIETAREMGLRQGPLNKSHGHAGRRGRAGKDTPEYITWMGMKSRCLNVKNIHFGNYGGRGIQVCERWMSFENFLSDMGSRPPGHTLDRIKSELNYEPGNCKWSTVTEQNRNRRDNRVIVFGGKSQPLAVWEEETGIGARTIQMRIDKLNWTVERALTTPARKFRRH